MVQASTTTFPIYKYLKLFCILSFCFGMDKGFLKQSKRIQYIFKTYNTIALIIMNVIILVKNDFTQYFLFEFLYVIETDINFVINTCFDQTKRNEIFTLLKEIDKLLKSSKCTAYKKIIIRINVLIIFVIFFRITNIIVNIIYNPLNYTNDEHIRYNFSYLIQFTSDVESIWRIILVAIVKKNVIEVKESLNFLLKNNFSESVFIIKRKRKSVLSDVLNAYVLISKVSTLMSNYFSFLVSY